MENHFNCIYLYTNKVNGKKYVGQTVDFNKRHKEHIYQAYNENCKAYNQYFHNAIRKHGIENFEIEILKENLLNQEELNYWECYYIQEFDTLANNRKGYNIGEGGYGNPLLGKTEEEMKEIRRKMSETNKEVWKNRTDEEMKEFSRKMGETWKNRTDEELAEIRRKMSEANKEAWKNKSDEEMKEFSRKRSEINREIWKNKTDEEIAEFSRKKSEIWKNRTDEELAEISKKYSERAKKTWKNRTDEELAEISRKLSEVYHNKSDEEKAERSRKISETWKNKSDEEMKEFSRKMSEINKGENNPHATLVDRFDKQDNYVDTKYQFEYVQLGFNACNISDCCKGRHKTHKGFIFKYHEE